MVNIRPDIRTFRSLKDEGFALITSVMVIFLVVSIVTTVALITAQDLRAAARARAIITTRLMSESVSDAIYATIARQNSLYEEAARDRFSNDGSAGTQNTNPLEPVNPGGYGLWFRLLNDGSLVRCTTREHLRETCFKAKIETTSPLALVRETVLLTIVARGGCIVRSDLSLKDCVYRKFTQVFQTRSFVDTAQFTNSEIPSGFPGANLIYVRPVELLPFPVAYLPFDEITGDVFSNDDEPHSGFYFCGDTSAIQKDTDGVFETSNPNGDPEALGAGDCQSSPTFSAAGGLSARFLPSQIDKSGSNQNFVYTPANVFRDLAGGPPSPSTPFSVDGPVTVALEYGNIVIGGVPRPYPSNGILYVNGDISDLSGRFSRSLSIVATGDVTISGDIVYAPNLGTLTDQDGSAQVTGDSLLGILSGKNIALLCPTTPSRCPNRNIVATLSAPYGTIYNNAWNTASTFHPVINPTKLNPPRINIYGTIIANSRPVFGSYFSTDSDPATPPGAIQYGWAKTITLDPRLEVEQPPYFFRTSQASVTRSGLESDSCNDPSCF